MVLDRSCLDGKRLAICDLDGTLVRLPVDWCALRGHLYRVCSDRGWNVAEGAGIDSLARSIREQHGEQAFLDVCAICAEYETAAVAAAPRNDQLLEMLRSCSGLRLAVLSLNTHRAVSLAVERCALASDSQQVPILGKEDVVRPKPDPEGILILLRAAKCGEAQAVMFGDRSVDEEAARAAGIDFCLVSDW